MIGKVKDLVEQDRNKPTLVGARRTYGFRDSIAILALDFVFNCENGGFWI